MRMIMQLATCLLAFSSAAPAESPASLTLVSPAYQNGGAIPERYTCEGKDISPPLAWSNLPAGTRSLALVIEDPDAPDPKAPRMTWVHWVLFNLPARPDSLTEGVKSGGLPAGTREGRNDWKRTGYGGPCPPVGRHRYFHRLYALDRVLEFKQPPTRGELGKAMEGHILATAELVGTYQKAK